MGCHWLRKKKWGCCRIWGCSREWSIWIKDRKIYLRRRKLYWRMRNKYLIMRNCRLKNWKWDISNKKYWRLPKWTPKERRNKYRLIECKILLNKMPNQKKIKKQKPYMEGTKMFPMWCQTIKLGRWLKVKNLREPIEQLMKFSWRLRKITIFWLTIRSNLSKKIYRSGHNSKNNCFS